jgi:hypothetical protein
MLQSDCRRNARRGVVPQGGHVGVVAFNHTGDPATGNFSEAKMIRGFSDVPNDLSALRQFPAMSNFAQHDGDPKFHHCRASAIIGG